MVQVRLDIFCCSCGNEDEVVIEVPSSQVPLARDGSLVKARGRVKECPLCVRMLLGADARQVGGAA